jgi:hypothetical protein
VPVTGGILITPRKKDPLVSGKLKVVVPSPEPCIVPIVENKAAYVVLDTADPSHSKNPAGAVDPAKAEIAPGGVPKKSHPDPLYILCTFNVESKYISPISASAGGDDCGLTTILLSTLNDFLLITFPYT